MEFTLTCLFKLLKPICKLRLEYLLIRCRTDPATGLPLQDRRMVPNTCLRNVIADIAAAAHEGLGASPKLL